MNKRILWGTFLLFAFFYTCRNSDKPASETLELNTQSISFDEKESEGFIGISSNARWTLTSDNDTWLKCTPASGEGNYSVRVIANANVSKNPRTGTITVKTSGGMAGSVQVTQAGLDPFINIDPVSVPVLPNGEDITVQTAASGSWTVQISEEAQSWVSVKSQTTAQAIFTVEPNTSGVDRSAAIIFGLDTEDLQATLELSQRRIIDGITINPESAKVSENTGEVTVNVTSDINWKVQIPGADTWVKMKQRSGNQVVFDIEENITGAERQSNIDFQTEDGTTVTTFVLTQVKGYVPMTSMNPEATQTGLRYDALNTYVKTLGFDYTENPHCTGGYGGHDDGVHLAVEKDTYLNKYVFRFDIHITPVIDGDRCNSNTTDRQRNELKSATNNTTWAKVQGNWDEWQRLEWKFKIPVGFQPTGSFCHIHQIKAQDGNNNGSPVITITPRSNSSGTNKRMQIIHAVDGASTGLGTVVDNIPLSDFEGEWVQVQEEIHYTHTGYFSIKITRIRDNKVLISYTNDNIDMWRIGASYLRNKYGIYRSLAGGDLSKNPVGQSALLKNESIWMCDFKIYEKNTNPNPGQAH